MISGVFTLFGSTVSDCPYIEFESDASNIRLEIPYKFAPAGAAFE